MSISDEIIASADCQSVTLLVSDEAIASAHCQSMKSLFLEIGALQVSACDVEVMMGVIYKRMSKTLQSGYLKKNQIACYC